MWVIPRLVKTQKQSFVSWKHIAVALCACKQQRTSVQQTQVIKTATPIPMNLCCVVKIEDSSILCNRVGSVATSRVSLGSYPICARKRSMKFDIVPVFLRTRYSGYFLLHFELYYSICKDLGVPKDPDPAETVTLTFHAQLVQTVKSAPTAATACAQ